MRFRFRKILKFETRNCELQVQNILLRKERKAAKQNKPLKRESAMERGNGRSGGLSQSMKE